MSSIRSKKRTVALDLPSDALDWLDSMAQEHSLPDKSKAARCCVNCAALTKMNFDGGDEEGDDDAREASMQNVGIELATEQVEWLENRAGASANDSEGRQKISVVLQRILRSCRNTDMEEVFGVIRCKSKVAICEGAQDAVGVLEKKYGKCC